MAYDVTDLDGTIIPPGTTGYQFGAPKNQPSGTKVNQKLINDMYLTWRVIMAQAAVSPNNTPDNDTNGYQLYSALSEIISPSFKSTGIVFATVGLNTWANLGGGQYNVGYKQPNFGNGQNNEASLCGAATITTIAPGTITVMTLPAGVRPSSTVVVPAYVAASGINAMVLVTISTAGVVSFSSAVTAAATIYFDNVRYRIS